MMTNRDVDRSPPDAEAFLVLERYTRALSAALGYRDLMTRLHSHRVVKLAMAMGACLGMDDTDMHVLRIAAAFHDIGKIGIPDRVLTKPSRLDEDEWQTVRQHSAMGEDILLATALAGAHLPALAIRHHHEHWNGRGYPDALTGADIPIHSRIIGIADSYDAMAVTRAYHAARPHAEIMAILHAETGIKHDPDLMRLFSRFIEDSPLRAGDKQADNERIRQAA